VVRRGQAGRQAIGGRRSNLANEILFQSLQEGWVPSLFLLEEAREVFEGEAKHSLPLSQITHCKRATREETHIPSEPFVSGDIDLHEGLVDQLLLALLVEEMRTLGEQHIWCSFQEEGVHFFARGGELFVDGHLPLVL
jgi:hypothetical protein